MRKSLLTLMALFAIVGSLVIGAGSFLTTNKFTKGIDYDKVAQIQTQLIKIKAEGIDLSKHPEHAKMFEMIESVPSKMMIMATKALSVLSIVIALAVCVATLDKQSTAIVISIALSVAACMLFIIKPELKCGMTCSSSLKVVTGIAVAMLILAANSKFSEIKRFP